MRIGVVLSIALFVGSANADPGWPKGEVLVPKKIFGGGGRDRIVMESNPRLYVYPDFDPKADLILVVGMDGWGGRSENFIDTMRLGLKAKGLTRRLVLAAIQDVKTRGPRYQGQGDKRHANVWRLDRQGFEVMSHFVDRLSKEFGHLRVYFVGYSSGSVAAPFVAAFAAETGNRRYTVEGSISLGVGSPIKPDRLKRNNLRALFIVVPKRERGDPRTKRDDQYKRKTAETLADKAVGAGATVYLRHIGSAKRHIDWHWGLMSQCRYFKGKRTDNGRGYYPHYWLPNPDSWGLMAVFIQGGKPPEGLENPRTKCGIPPNPNNLGDPG